MKTLPNETKGCFDLLQHRRKLVQVSNYPANGKLAMNGIPTTLHIVQLMYLLLTSTVPNQVASQRVAFKIDFCSCRGSINI